MTKTTERHEREQRAREAWKALPQGSRSALVLQVQCASGHHIAKVFDTHEGAVVVTTVRSHSHGDRDLPDEPHTPHGAREYVDLLEAGELDAIPAWCDCGHRVLSRQELRAWMAARDQRIIVD